MGLTDGSKIDLSSRLLVGDHNDFIVASNYSEGCSQMPLTVRCSSHQVSKPHKSLREKKDEISRSPPGLFEHSSG